MALRHGGKNRDKMVVSGEVGEGEKKKDKGQESIRKVGKIRCKVMLNVKVSIILYVLFLFLTSLA
jgi:hypothetical protein